MSPRSRWSSWRRTSAIAESLPADDWQAQADAISLPRLDEVGGHARPPEIGVTYVEREYADLATEQTAAWTAAGEAAARPASVQARGQDAAADAAGFLVLGHQAEVQAAQADRQHAVRVLATYVRREAGAKLRYAVGWPILALGDASGVLSAAIALGDEPLVAAGQALSSGLAAACAGLVGSELKYLQLARARQCDPATLSADEQRYRRLFSGPASNTVLRLIGLVSLLVVLLVGVAVGALRSSVEGGAAGLTFGLLAAATALGSGLLGYAAADDVADLLAAAERRVRRAEAHHRTLADAVPLRRRAEADETARSLRAEYAARGQAARQRVEALGWRVLRRNTQVMGHGYPSGEPTGIVGRTRRGGVA